MIVLFFLCLRVWRSLGLNRMYHGATILFMKHISCTGRLKVRADNKQTGHGENIQSASSTLEIKK